MDKLRSKRLAAAVGIPTPHGVVMRSVADCETVIEKIGLPLIVKPGSQGSSVGMSKVEAAGDLAAAYQRAAAVDEVVFAEPWISGAEYTVAVLHRRALPAIRIETARSFYDYEAKYLRDDTKYHCPAGLSAAAEAHMASLAIAAFDATGAEGWGRADFMADQTGRPQLLEINTVPGMTDHSLVPMAARAAGIDFDELCWQILETSFVRERVKENA
jgi:D-alanine-D-alanine ligase